jgi:hypothetical protein
MRLGLTAMLVAAAALIAAGLLGVASAEAPTTTPVRTVGVEGTGNAPIAREANATVANAAYRQAMAAAISDGLEKAQFLATRVGGTLGAVQSVVEENGYVSCEGEGNEYNSYLGVEPDFGSGQAPSGRFEEAAPSASSRSRGSAPTTAHKSKPKNKKKAKKASAVSCTVSASVAINYELA